MPVDFYRRCWMQKLYFIYVFAVFCGFLRTLLEERVVRPRRLELPRVAPLPPQSSVSTNSTMAARQVGSPLTTVFTNNQEGDCGSFLSNSARDLGSARELGDICKSGNFSLHIFST